MTIGFARSESTCHRRLDIHADASMDLSRWGGDRVNPKWGWWKSGMAFQIYVGLSPAPVLVCHDCIHRGRNFQNPPGRSAGEKRLGHHNVPADFPQPRHDHRSQQAQGNEQAGAALCDCPVRDHRTIRMGWREYSIGGMPPTLSNWCKRIIYIEQNLMNLKPFYLIEPIR